MKITVEMPSDTQAFEGPSEACLFLLGHVPGEVPEKAQREALGRQLVILTEARGWWVKALEAYRVNVERGYADPVGVTTKQGFAAFHSEAEALEMIGRLEARIARLRSRIGAILLAEEMAA